MKIDDNPKNDTSGIPYIYLNWAEKKFPVKTGTVVTVGASFCLYIASLKSSTSPFGRLLCYMSIFCIKNDICRFLYVIYIMKAGQSK